MGWRVGPGVDVDAFEAGLLLAQWSSPALPDRPVITIEGVEEMGWRVVVACDFAFPTKRMLAARGPPVHRWNEKVTAMWGDCVRVRRAITYSNRRPGEPQVPNPWEARKKLKLTIRRSKTKCWANLLDSVERDLRKNPTMSFFRKFCDPPISRLLEVDVLERTAETLFPANPPAPPPPILGLCRWLTANPRGGVVLT